MTKTLNAKYLLTYMYYDSCFVYFYLSPLIYPCLIEMLKKNHKIVDTFPVFSTHFMCGYFDFNFKETPSNLFQILKNLQLLRGNAPQTPQRGVAPAPDQGPAGPWTPVQDF